MLFRAGIRIAAIFNPKARKWLQGRKDIFGRLQAAIGEDDRTIWMHCASLGEFEQGRPLLEKLRATYPGHRLLLTFFSPSGYEIRKDFPGVDWVFYLPLDGSSNARRFLNIVKPRLVVFVKYEYWYFYLRQIKAMGIPFLLISALFQARMPFFKWYGGLHRNMLGCFTHLFVQDEPSRQLLATIDFDKQCTVSGDTRFDRVIEIAEHAGPVPGIDDFASDRKTIVAGSTWSEDEQLLQQVMYELKSAGLKLVIAPHEIHEQHIQQLRVLFPSSRLYSELVPGQPLAAEQVLIIDNIGMLSRLYRHAWITYIGGGFGKGIHNTLEAAVYGKPVLFGPAYGKFREAVELVRNGGAKPVSNAEEARAIVSKLLGDENAYSASAAAAGEYVLASRGATKKVMDYIQEKRLLTS